MLDDVDDDDDNDDDAFNCDEAKFFFVKCTFAFFLFNFEI